MNKKHYLLIRKRSRVLVVNLHDVINDQRIDTLFIYSTLCPPLRLRIRLLAFLRSPSLQRAKTEAELSRGRGLRQQHGGHTPLRALLGHHSLGN
jgi:hypothetical protein